MHFLNSYALHFKFWILQLKSPLLLHTDVTDVTEVICCYCILPNGTVINWHYLSRTTCTVTRTIVSFYSRTAQEWLKTVRKNFTYQ